MLLMKGVSLVSVSTENGEHLFDLMLKGSMKNFRDLFVDSDGNVVVLQGDGVWKYSYVFARW